MDAQRTWFITGSSAGFGMALAREALDRGHRVVATARDPAAVEHLVRAFPDRCIAPALDVTRPGQVDAAVRVAHDRFGAIDVLVNNAGRGFITAVEHARDDEIRALFDLNFFGTVAVTRAVLPGMRERRRGHVLNISSTAGLMARPGSAFYAASKFAMEGFSEALAAEVEPFGLHVTLVEPSAFRTRFSTALHRGQAAGYDETVGKRLQQFDATRGREPGDPQRAAQAIVAVVERPQPPLRLPLGRGAVDTMRQKIASLQRDLEAGEAAAIAADFPRD